MERIILHSDLNGFYASVECFANPKLRGLPVVVGGDPELRHGIVLAKNEMAKKFGIKTGDAIWQAKQKCPEIVSVKPDYERYHKFSRLAREIYYRYSDQVEPFGIDECWLDVTNSQDLFGSGERIANEIRDVIRNELGITASVGVSFNKIFAKLGSDMKKPDATSEITRDNYKSLVWRLPTADLLYVGYATAMKLRKAGIYTIGQLAAADTQILHSQLGKWGIVLSRFANGLDTATINEYDGSAPDETDSIVSIGNSKTLPRDVSTMDEIRNVIYFLSDSVASRLREHGFKCKTVKLYIRDNTLDSCEVQGQLRYPTSLTGEIAEKAIEIFKAKYKMQQPIRSMGVRATGLTPKLAPVQLDLFMDYEMREKHERAESTADRIRKRFGYGAIQRGNTLVDTNLTAGSPKEDHLIHPVNYFNGAIM